MGLRKGPERENSGAIVASPGVEFIYLTPGEADKIVPDFDALKILTDKAGRVTVVIDGTFSPKLQTCLVAEALTRIEIVREHFSSGLDNCPEAYELARELGFKDGMALAEELGVLDEYKSLREI